MQHGEGTSRRAPPWVGEGPLGPRAAAQVSVTARDEGGSCPPPRLLRRAPAQIHRGSSMARAGKGRREQGFRARKGTIRRRWAVPTTSDAGAAGGHAGELCSRGCSIRERRGSRGRRACELCRRNAAGHADEQSPGAARSMDEGVRATE
jgi:hypothetical protein